MIGKPLTAAQWNDAFQTNAGEKIVDLLMPFHERPLVLGPAPADLERRLDNALRAIGYSAQEIAVVSVGALRDTAPKIPGIDPDSLHRGTLVELSEQIRSKCDDELAGMLDRWFARVEAREEPHDRIPMTQLVRMLDGSLIEHLRRIAPHAGFLESAYLGYVRQFNLLRCLTYQVGLLIYGTPEAVENIATFTSLMLRGVNPMVLLKDGTFIVITA